MYVYVKVLGYSIELDMHKHVPYSDAIETKNVCTMLYNANHLWWKASIHSFHIAYKLAIVKFIGEITFRIIKWLIVGQLALVVVNNSTE